MPFITRTFVFAACAFACAAHAQSVNYPAGYTEGATYFDKSTGLGCAYEQSTIALYQSSIANELLFVLPDNGLQYTTPNAEGNSVATYLGVMRFVFTGAKVGNVGFDEVTASGTGFEAPKVTFSKYVTTTDSSTGTFTVSAQLTFAGTASVPACTIPFKATFRITASGSTAN